MSDEQFCTEAACKYLGLKRNSFYNCINRGEIAPANPAERPYLFKKSDLDRWIQVRDRKKNMKKQRRIADKKILLPYKLIQLG
jgi:excisionase family DNA binding protein